MSNASDFRFPLCPRKYPLLPPHISSRGSVRLIRPPFTLIVVVFLLLFLFDNIRRLRFLLFAPSFFSLNLIRARPDFFRIFLLAAVSSVLLYPCYADVLLPPSIFDWLPLTPPLGIRIGLYFTFAFVLFPSDTIVSPVALFCPFPFTLFQPPSFWQNRVLCFWQVILNAKKSRPKSLVLFCN